MIDCTLNIRRCQWLDVGRLAFETTPQKLGHALLAQCGSGTTDIFSFDHSPQALFVELNHTMSPPVTLHNLELKPIFVQLNSPCLFHF